MTSLRTHRNDRLDPIPRMPPWLTSARRETLEDSAFLSGAALGHMTIVLGCEDVPQALLRQRLALQAAEACVVLSGRPERARDLRDAVDLLRPGDQPGPAGEVCLRWRRAVDRPVSVKALCRALPSLAAADIAGWRDAGLGAPVARASAVLEAILRDRPRAEDAALIMADAALAQALGWEHMVPLLAIGLKRRDLRLTGDDLRHACHAALVASVVDAVQMALALARQADRLRAAAPKLRAKGADAAIAMFLSRDAVTPAALPLPDRAARRLCDRLVALGAVRELTGRDTFRLYGV